MKINSLLENVTPSSTPVGNNPSSAPKFGRDPKVLEDDKIEETTAGSIASVSQPIGSIQKRGPGALFKGIKTSKKFPNSEAVKEEEIKEQDLIINPILRKGPKAGFHKKDYLRQDHEVEMARSDLVSANKNAKKIYELIKDLSEEDGLEGWVQEKIIKANDYLNSAREYLENKELEQKKSVMDEGGFDIPEIPRAPAPKPPNNKGVAEGEPDYSVPGNWSAHSNFPPTKVLGSVYNTKGVYLGKWDGKRLIPDSNRDSVWHKWRDEQGDDWAQNTIATAPQMIQQGRWTVKPEQGVAEGEVDEGWKQNVAAAALAAGNILGTPAQASEPTKPITIAYVTINGETRKYNLGDKFSSVKEAEEFISNILNKKGLSGYSLDIKRGYPAKKTNESISTNESLSENLRKWFKEKWVRFGPDGKIKGDCARGDDSEGKPKCLPQSKAHSLGKKGRASAAARKRREDPNPERSGKAINVATKKKANEEQIDELKCWTGYHRVKGVPAGAPGSCAKNEDVAETVLNPKDPKADYEAKRKALYDLSLDKNVDQKDVQQRRIDLDKEAKDKNVIEEHTLCPKCGGAMYSEDMINEKKDACYYKVKSRYKVWPSAYASGALVKCRKKGAKNWGNKSK